VTTARRLRAYPYEQYLRALADSHIKLEFFEGEIYAMAGGTPSHAQLGAKVIALLQRGLSPGCAVFTSDLKVLIESADLATFPDASLVCGPLAAAPKDPNALTNPMLVVEVTSPSTESYDRTEKLRSYQQLRSLSAVLIVSHRARRVTLVRRSDDGGWEEVDFRGGEAVVVATPGVKFLVDELYEGVVLEA
jgi:Uma2 family endonuclease